MKATAAGDATEAGWGRTAELELGIVVRREPGATAWAEWIWRPVAVLPGAPPAHWRELRRDGEAVEYHAATLTLEVHRAETEAYLLTLNSESPSVFVIMRESEEEAEEFPFEVVLVTASAAEAQDYLDSGEDIVEPVPMPPPLRTWLEDFVAFHHRHEPFRKRRRKDIDVRPGEDGRGDPRVNPDDVFLSPADRRRRGRKP